MSSMRFDIITIFPKVVEAYFGESILKRAIKNRVIDVKVHDLRKFTNDKHHKVDDKPYGGGPGMVLKIEPLAQALSSILNPKSQARNPKQISKSKTEIIFLSASGKQFDSKMAARLAKKYDRVILIAGHYEGIDERIISVVRNWKLEIRNLSTGHYVLTGGELPAMAIVDAISRHVPGVLGKTESLEERRHGVGVPVYTRPEVFVWPRKNGGKYAVPKVLLSGNHKKIEEWRKRRKVKQF